jgi:hypothetical protein
MLSDNMSQKGNLYNSDSTTSKSIKSPLSRKNQLASSNSERKRYVGKEAEEKMREVEESLSKATFERTRTIPNGIRVTSIDELREMLKKGKFSVDSARFSGKASLDEVSVQNSYSEKQDGEMRTMSNPFYFSGGSWVGTSLESGPLLFNISWGGWTWASENVPRIGVRSNLKRLNVSSIQNLATRHDTQYNSAFVSVNFITEYSAPKGTRVESYHSLGYSSGAYVDEGFDSFAWEEIAR